MKTFFLLLTAIVFMVVACGEKSEPSTDAIASINKKETSKMTPATHKSGMDLSKMPTDKKFYKRMLISFCEDNYKEKFGKEFNASGFNVSKINPVNDSTVTAKGLYTYNNKNSSFKATIKRVAKDTYKITFEIEIDFPYTQKNRWDDTTATITFKE